MIREGFGKYTELQEWGRGVDMELFTPERRSKEFRAARGIEENDVVILWVGRLVPEKRPEIWMSVVRRLQDEGIPVKAMVVGHGTFEATLSQMKDITCCGWLSGTALAEAYASADVLLFPSEVETFGNVTLEALASGCPCIVEDKCGGHLVEHGHNGFTCPASDAEKFYKATKRIVQEHTLRKQMSVNARTSAWKFERHKILQQMLEHYKDAIVRHSDPNYIKRRMQISPETAGRNILSVFCCNYWFIKHFAEPILNTTTSLQNVAYSTSDFVSYSRTRFNCSESNRNGGTVSAVNPGVITPPAMDDKCRRYDDEKKGRLPSSAMALFLLKAVDITAVGCSYLIVILFVYASFTVK